MIWVNLMECGTGGCRERRIEKGRKGKTKGEREWEERNRRSREGERKEGKKEGRRRKRRRMRRGKEKREGRKEGREGGGVVLLSLIIPTIGLVLPLVIQAPRAPRLLGTSQALACSLPPRLAVLYAPRVA